MWLELLVATLMVIASVLTHGAGLLSLANVMRLEGASDERRRVGMDSPRAMLAFLVIVLGIFALHGIEIWAWAALYLTLDAIPDLRTAVYFSCFTYSTLGDGLHHLPEEWRLLAAIQGITGVLLIGWSTAFFVTMVLRLGRD